MNKPDLALLSKLEQLQGYTELLKNPFLQSLFEGLAHDVQTLSKQIFSEDKLDGIEGILLREQQIGEVRALARPERLLTATIKALIAEVEAEQNPSEQDQKANENIT